MALIIGGCKASEIPQERRPRLERGERDLIKINIEVEKTSGVTVAGIIAGAIVLTTLIRVLAQD